MIKNLTIAEVSDLSLNPWVKLMHELWPKHDIISLQLEAQKILKSKKETAFLLSIDEKFVGFVNVSMRSDYVPGATQSPVGYIEGIYIKPRLRHRGLAKKLVEQATHWFLANGCREMASDAEIDNMMSQGWHEAMGFTKVNLLVHYVKKLEML